MRQFPYKPEAKEPGGYFDFCVSGNVDGCDDVEGQSVGKNGFPASVVSRQDCWWLLGWVTYRNGTKIDRVLCYHVPPRPNHTAGHARLLQGGLPGKRTSCPAGANIVYEYYLDNLLS